MAPGTTPCTNAPLERSTVAGEGAADGVSVVGDTSDDLTDAVHGLRSSADVVAAAMVAAWRDRMRPAQAGPLHRV